MISGAVGSLVLISLFARNCVSPGSASRTTWLRNGNAIFLVKFRKA